MATELFLTVLGKFQMVPMEWEINKLNFVFLKWGVGNRVIFSQIGNYLLLKCFSANWEFFMSIRIFFQAIANKFGTRNWAQLNKQKKP